MEFRVTYDKEEIFTGLVVPKCDWGKLGENNIKLLEFRVGNLVYTLGGFKEYNIKLEKMALGKQGISKIFVFARGEKESFVLSCYKSEEGMRIDEIKTSVGHEYGEIKVNDWRNGEFDEPYVVKFDMATKKIKGVYQA